jgi:hypothetical protein
MEGCVGLKDIFKSDKAPRTPVNIPESMKPVDPVNYNSVLDYLVGLSPEDFKKMTKSAEIYRKANKDVANLLDVEDEPTTSIVTDKPEISDDDLDNMLSADKDELTTAFLDDDVPAVDKKKKQATAKKVEIKED